MGKGARNRQQAPRPEWLHSERHVEYGRAKHGLNRLFFIDDYNVKTVRTTTCGFNVEKVHQDKLPAMFKMRGQQSDGK
uniref:Transposase n=1 Tax=Romanomermis culicivorax TaxID=13658 RepID=A0A915JGR3_ROMCU